MKLFDMTSGTEIVVNDAVAGKMLSRGGYRPSLPLPGNEAPAKPAGLPAGPSAERLYRTAAALEAKLEALKGNVQAAEKALAAAFADEADVNSASRKLTEARDQLAAAIAALGQLEKQAHSRAVLERKHGESVIYYDMHAELLKHRQKIRGAIVGALPAELKAEAETLSRQADQILWNMLQGKAAERFQSLPRVPAPPLPRDAHGRPLSEVEVLEAARKAVDERKFASVYTA